MAKTAPITIPATLRAKVMARAWEIFRTTYRYPAVAFGPHGRFYFKSALKTAWHEARETVRLAACGVDNLKRWIEDFSVPAHAVGLSTSWALSTHALMERARQRDFYVKALAVAEAG